MNIPGLAKNVVLGRAKILSDQKLFHRVSLTAVFAWAGLGANPVSPSCYGPESVFLVNGSNGPGRHALLAVIRWFPRVRQNFIFLQVGVVDAGSFEKAAAVENLRTHPRRQAARYAAHMRQPGFYAEARTVGNSLRPPLVLSCKSEPILLESTPYDTASGKTCVSRIMAKR